MNILRELLTVIWNGVGLGVLFCLPMAFLGWRLHVRRKEYRGEALEPFTEMPLRPPGESTRLKLEQLSEEFDGHLLGLVLACAATASLAFALKDVLDPYVGLLLFLFVAGVTWRTGRRVAALQNKIWDYRLGMMGERAVGEELNQLLTAGFQVFHDVPFDGFNIDHVLVGPPGVYSVETKARRKPTDVRGLEKARIYSDGVTLRLPKYTDTDAIEQARRNAATLAKLLTRATGEHVTVSPILTFPGWSVIREKPCDVNVLRPDEIKRSFPNRPKQPLSPEQIQRIAHQLTELCRLEKPPKE